MEPHALPQSQISERLYYILPLSTHLANLLSTVPTAVPVIPLPPPPTHIPPPGTIPATGHPLHPSFAYLDYATPYIRVWDTVAAAKLAAEKAGKEIGGEWKFYAVRKWELGYIVGSPGREGEFLVRQPPDLINPDGPKRKDDRGKEMEGIEEESKPIKTARARLGGMKPDRRESRKPAVLKKPPRKDDGEGLIEEKAPSKKKPLQERGGMKSDNNLR